MPGHNFRLIERKSQTETVNIASSGNVTTEIVDMRDYSLLLIHMPAGWTSASIGFKVASEAAGTFLPLYDDNGTLVQVDSPAVDCAYSAPAEVAVARFVKLWSQDGSAGNTAQTSARVLLVDKKA